MHKTYLGVVLSAAVLLLAGCSQPPKATSDDTAAKAQAPTGPPELVTAKTAYWPMYMSARTWTTDFVTLKMAEKEVPGFTNENGKAAMWEATFGSPSQQEYRTYTYAIVAHPPDIYKGVVVGRGLPWGGVTRAAMPIQSSDFNVDSDAAYKAAATEAAAWLKKNPEKKITVFELWNAYKYQAPVWYLMWGTKTSGYVVLVNASTGAIVKGK